MGQGRIAQGAAKLQQAADNLDEAEAESQAAYGKLLALLAMSRG
jgi:hypothetical protein